MATPSSTQYFEAIHTSPTSPLDPNLFTASEIVAGSFSSGAVSTATSTAVSTITAAAPDSANLSVADSKGVSSGTRASIADSKAVSGSVNTSTVDSKASSGSVNTSIADSKAVSVQNSAPIVTVVANSQNVSTADSKAVSSATTFAAYRAIEVVNVKDAPYLAVGDGIADDTAALQAAITAASSIYLPPGTYKTSTVLTGPAGGTPRTIRGAGIAATVIQYIGTGSGIKFLGVKNGSSYGQIRLSDLTVSANNAVAADAGVEFSGSSAFNTVARVKVTGSFKFGFVLDQSEVTTLEDCIAENGALPSTAIIPNSINFWIVNGADRIGGTSTGFTNVISLLRYQTNNATYGVVDDGGGGHVFDGANHNANSVPMRIAGATGFNIRRVSLETSLTTGAANLLFTNTTLSGGTVGGCVGGAVNGVSFEGGVNSAPLLVFAGDWHQGIKVFGNHFGSTLGRIAAIDVTWLRWSTCESNNDSAGAGVSHFTGVHHDANGNVLFPPKPMAADNAYVFGRSDIQTKLAGGVDIGPSNTTPILRYVEYSTAWDPPNLAGAAQQFKIVTVTGARLGNKVLVSFSLSLNQTTMEGYVDSNDTVVVIHKNGTAGAIDLGSGTLTCGVLQV